MANPLEVERFGTEGGNEVLALRGPLTIENLQPFQNAIRRQANVQTVVLDFTNVPYMDSSGLGSLVSAYVGRQKSGRRVALSGVNDRVLRLLEITRMESLFLIFATAEEALAALGSAAEA
jgi:anti-sigma B factor antagonist